MISISIVSFNAIENIVVCIDSILEYTKLPDYEILVNGFNFSQENKKYLNSKYGKDRRVVITYSKGIRGYSANHNINLVKARYGFVCILNDDTFVREDIFSSFIRILQQPNVGGCCPIFLNFDGSVQLLQRKKVSPWYYLAAKMKLDKLFSFLSSYEKISEFEKYRNREFCEINYGHGACFCLNRAYLVEGKLSEEYFLSPDDLYWSYLLRKQHSKKIILSCQNVIYHKGHAVISNLFPSALPSQIKGMVDMFGKMGYRSLFLFNIFFFFVLILGFLFNIMMFAIFRRDRFRLLRRGYGNTIKVFWKKVSSPAIFRFYYKEEAAL